MSDDRSVGYSDNFYEHLGVMQKYGYGLVFALIEVIRPRLKVEDGCIMPAHQAAGDLQNWIASVNGDRIAAQAYINHMHISDLLSDVTGASLTDHARLVELAEVYAALLEAEVKRVAPGRAYRVEVSGVEESKTDPEQLEVTAWLERPGGA